MKIFKRSTKKLSARENDMSVVTRFRQLTTVELALTAGAYQVVLELPSEANGFSDEVRKKIEDLLTELRAEIDTRDDRADSISYLEEESIADSGQPGDVDNEDELSSLSKEDYTVSNLISYDMS